MHHAGEGGDEHRDPRGGMAGPTVIVAGAGPAGTRAAARLVEAGLRPLVVDEGRQSGGQIYRRQPENFRRKPSELYGFEAAKAKALRLSFAMLPPHIEYLAETLAWNLFDGALHLRHR